MTQQTDRLNTALAGRYRIERHLGEGGMASVYLCDDLKHDRKVALKLLKPELAAVLGADRFVVEIKTTAALQHPHILPLFDSGTADGFLFYVMPFIDGETLRAKLDRETQLGVDESVRIAREVADALEYAHQHGIVHRDIKPENILLHGGHAMVADFGIALAVSAAAGGRMTETGLSLGTPHYMSPEQATAEKDISARSDVYSLGSVLYEMLAGQPPHIGGSAQQIIMKIITEPAAPVTQLRKSVPANVAAAVAKSLEKLPADRFESAKAFADALANVSYTDVRHAPAGGLASGRGRSISIVTAVTMTAGAIAVSAVASFWIASSRAQAPRPTRSVHFLIAGNDSERPFDGMAPWPAAISPDGGMVVYGVERKGDLSFYSLRTDQLDGHPIPGATNASQPIFSPNGEWLAYEGAGGKFWKVRFDGSAPVAVTDAGGDNGADWTVGDEIVLGSEAATHGLSHVSAAGGERVEFTRPDSTKGEADHVWPIACADGKTIVFAIFSGTNATSRLAVTSLADGKVTPLGLKGVRPLAALDGTLVYVQADGQVMAVPFDVRGRRTTGTPVPVVDPVAVTAGSNGNSSIFISRGGALVESHGAARGELSWVARAGTSTALSREDRGYFAPRLSPDGRRIAVAIGTVQSSDIWIYDLATTTLTPLTSLDGARSPEWTPDGSRVLFVATGPDKQPGIWSQRADGGAPAELVFRPAEEPSEVAVSPNGHDLLFSSMHGSSWSILRVPKDTPSVARVYVSDVRYSAQAPRFSPDGHWVAFITDESGRDEVYVRSYPDPSARVQISAGGGDQPIWSADGTRIYYWQRQALLEAKLATAPMIRVLSRDTVVAHVPELSGEGGFGHANYDVARDGRLLTTLGSTSAFQLVVIPNWGDELRAKMKQAAKK